MKYGCIPAFLLAGLVYGCARLTAHPQISSIQATTGPAATQQAMKLASARGGPAAGKTDPKLEVVALFDGKAMPTGVTVSRQGRLFLCIPRWGEKVQNTVVELHGEQLLPYPTADANQFDPSHPDKFDPRAHLVSVQSVVMDAHDRLWIVDPGSVDLAPILNGAPKLWCYDLASGQRVKEIHFPNDVTLKRTYLNDLRIDLNRGAEGTAYLTDSGVGGIIVVDLASGQSWRRLDGQPSVLPTPNLQQTSEGRPLLQRKPSGEVAGPDFHSDGIALSPDGKTLYYNAIASHDVFSIPTDLLTDRNADEQKVANAVKKVATKPSGNDGLICDARGRIYSTDFEENAIRRIDPSTGAVETIVQDGRLLWPDTFAMHDNYLYVTSNQLARQPVYHFGKDERQPPYALFRVQIDSGEKAGGAK